MIALILLGIFIFLVFLVKSFNSQDENFKKQHNVSVMELIESGTYVSGHPQLDEPLKGTKIHFDYEKVKIFTAFQERASIPKIDIKNVLIEDSSTIQTRVGIRRMLMVGIFAFAWKKKQKLESCYLVIEWKQGQFENETIFEFEGNGSIQRANTLRNRFIQYLTN